MTNLYPVLVVIHGTVNSNGSGADSPCAAWFHAVTRSASGPAPVVWIDLAQDAVHERPEAVPALGRTRVEVAEVVDRGDDLPADREGSALVSQQPTQVTPDRFALVDQVRVCVLPLGNRGDL